MSKVFLAIFILISIFLVACGTSSDKNSDSSSQTQLSIEELNALKRMERIVL